MGQKICNIQQKKSQIILELIENVALASKAVKAELLY